MELFLDPILPKEPKCQKSYFALVATNKLSQTSSYYRSFVFILLLSHTSSSILIFSHTFLHFLILSQVRILSSLQYLLLA